MDLNETRMDNATSDNAMPANTSPDVDESRRLFPLPLAPVEQFLVGDDDRQHPKTFGVELAFSGRPDRQAVEDAIAQSVARHPLLQAYVEPAGRGLVWVPARTRVPVDWLDPGAPFVSPRGHWIDIRQECGLRAWVQSDESRSSLGFQFHHACCDGRGAREWIGDFMTAYARGTGSSAYPPWRVLNYERLRQRAVFRPAVTNGQSVKTSVWQKLVYAYRFHLQGPRALAVPRDPSLPNQTSLSGANGPDTPDGSQTNVSLIHRHVFTRAEFRRIAERVGPQETLNDVAVALLFQTLAAWNRRHGQARHTQRLRILMPMDLREHADVRLPAANRMSFSFLSRTVGECGEWRPLVDGIGKETGKIKTTRFSLDFLAGLEALQGLGPRALPWLMRLQGCIATAVLTNLGDLSRRFRRMFPTTDDGRIRIGNLVLDAVFGTPPIRPRTHAGFGICIYAEQMAVSGICNTCELGDRGASELFASYINAWRRWAELESADGTLLEPSPKQSGQAGGTHVPLDR